MIVAIVFGVQNMARGRGRGGLRRSIPENNMSDPPPGGIPANNNEGDGSSGHSSSTNEVQRREADPRGSPADTHQRPATEPTPSTDLETRKRKLDLEIEATRLKLRLIEAEKERLDLGVEILDGSSILDGSGGGSSTSNAIAQNLVETISKAFADALRVDRDARCNSNPPTLLNRLTSDKQTLSFSGNALEWLRFKRAFQQSTELGGYTDRENASRLFSYLKGEARTVVESLMITTESAEEIMEALERHYGNKDEIVRRLLSSIRKLPRLGSGSTNIVTFASVVKNNVTALKSIGHSSYLNNLDLIQEVIEKIPSAMIYRYNEFVAQKEGPPNLSTLSEFLTREADMANKAGTVRVTESSHRERGAVRDRKDSHQTSRRIYAVSNRTRSRSPRKENKCGFCASTNHKLVSCPRFTALDLDGKWQWVRRESRCYKCLSREHLRPECQAMDCSIAGCGRPHNRLLHADRNPRKSAPIKSSTQVNTEEKSPNST